MKTMVILLMLCVVGNAQAQKVIQLGEARIKYSPDMKITSNLDNLKFTVNEDFAGQFSQNALKFVEENFNIQDLIGSLEPGTYDQFDVTFKSRKGFLLASFDGKGKLVKTFQKFNDIALPHELRKEIYINYKGYSMIKNKYVAYGKGNKINKHQYLITMRNGDDKKRIKLEPAVVAGGNVAANY